MLAWFVRVCVVAFVAVVLVMHVLRRDIDPLAHGISRYQVGPSGAAMSIAFAVLGVALFTTAGALANRRSVSTLLKASGLGSFAVAAFPLPPEASLFAHVIHQTGGGASIAGALLAALLTGPTGLSRAGAVAGVLFVISGAFRETPIGAVMGLLQRTTIAAICVWLIAVQAKGRPQDPP